MNKPNVLVILTDDQRFDALHAAGNMQIRTPHMDALAARGTMFTQAHICGGTSAAVCMPSRAMLHTGRTLFRLEGAGQEIPEAHALLGDTFRAAGYRTFGTGKWHNGRRAFQRSFSAGDEIFFGGMADHWNVPVYHYDPEGQYSARCLCCPDPMASNRTKARECDHMHVGRHSSEVISDAAVKFLETYREPDPFMMYVSYLAPHDPRTMPEQYRTMYNPRELQLPPNFMAEHPFDHGVLRVRDEMLAPFPRTGDSVREHLAEYYGMISHLDDQLGRVLAMLEGRGWRDNTIIVFAGDNGLALGQHGLMGKQSCYEHSVRVPLMLAGPGIPVHQQTDAPVFLADIFPALCELTGLKTPASVEGQSFVPVLKGQSTGREALYLAYCDLHRAVKTRQHKLVEYVLGGRHVMTQLFDLKADPWECDNLADRPECRDLLEGLRQQLIAGRDAGGDLDTEWGRRFWSGLRLS